jgi:DNA-binding transcriptional regulator LsrR (DeoR family)
MTHRSGDFEQLVTASRLYYELGETQNAIAERLGVTRPQVSRLLKRARAEGIVEIRIIDRTSAESPAADALRRSYGLDAVHLAPTMAGPEDLARRMVGRLAAQVLRSVVRDGAVVGIGDGAGVSAVADALDEAASPVAATVVPLTGGYWSPGPDREPFRRIADALGAQVHGLMAPGLLDDAPTRDALAAQTARALDDLDAVGEILIAPFDLDGVFVCAELRERVIGFDARALGRVPVSIGVAAGESKVRPILGALRAGVVRTLVSDVATAEAVVTLDAQTLQGRS